MAFQNSTYDLTAEEKAAVVAIDRTYVYALRAGSAPSPVPSDADLLVIKTLIRACRGRGMAQPLTLLLGMYCDASPARTWASDMPTPAATNDRPAEEFVE